MLEKTYKQGLIKFYSIFKNNGDGTFSLYKKRHGTHNSLTYFTCEQSALQGLESIQELSQEYLVLPVYLSAYVRDGNNDDVLWDSAE